MFHGWFSFKIACVISITKFNFCNKMVPWSLFVAGWREACAMGPLILFYFFLRRVSMQFIEPFRKIGRVQTLKRRTAVTTETTIFWRACRAVLKSDCLVKIEWKWHSLYKTLTYVYDLAAQRRVIETLFSPRYALSRNEVFVTGMYCVWGTGWAEEAVEHRALSNVNSNIDVEKIDYKSHL
jgi:hypothetical protein